MTCSIMSDVTISKREVSGNLRNLLKTRISNCYRAELKKKDCLLLIESEQRK